MNPVISREQVVIVVVIVWGWLGTEPGTLLWNNGAVFCKEDEDEGVEGGQVASVGGIVGFGNFVVDVCEKCVGGEVGREIFRIAEILGLMGAAMASEHEGRERERYLNDVILCPFAVYSTLCESARDLAGDVGASAEGEIGYAHVLRAKRDEVVYGRDCVRVALDVCAEELTACWRVRRRWLLVR